MGGATGPRVLDALPPSSDQEGFDTGMDSDSSGVDGRAAASPGKPTPPTPDIRGRPASSPTEYGRTAVEPGSRGFIFAATGPKYITAARRAAKTLRRHMPDAWIDLFADEPPEDPVFDREHRLADSYFRPKIEALRRTRFERTVYLDTDIVTLMPVPELFDTLDHCEIAAALGVSRMRIHMRPKFRIPRALPVLNTGVICLKASSRMQNFLRAWESALRARGERVDQAVFRRMIYRQRIRLFPLGYEYNFKVMKYLDVWSESQGAPRLLHCSKLNRIEDADPRKPIRLREVLSKHRVKRLRALITLDQYRLSTENTSNEELEAARLALKETANAERPFDSAASSIASNTGLTSEASGAERVPDRTEQPPAGDVASAQSPKRKAKRKKPVSPYWAAVLSAMPAQRPLRIVVVGANDGRFNDPIFRLVKNELTHSSEVVLFEPQKLLIPYLAENYAFHPAHTIVNAAVGPECELSLHVVKPEAWPLLRPAYARNWPEYRAPTGVSSGERDAVLKWIRKTAPEIEDPEVVVSEVRVPCAPLPDALRRIGLSPEVDVLQVDAEGLDDEVIYASEIGLSRPSVIYFEDANMPKARKDALHGFLKRDYRLLAVDRDILAIRRRD